MRMVGQVQFRNGCFLIDSNGDDLYVKVYLGLIVTDNQEQDKQARIPLLTLTRHPAHGCG